VEIRQVAVALVEIEAVPDEELVRDREAHVADREVVDEPPVRPVEERDDRERGGLAELERAADVVEGEAGVDHVLDDQDVAPLDLRVEVLEQADPRVPAGARARAVAGELDEVDRVRDAEGAREVAREDDARLQRRDEERLATGIVVRQLARELGDARRQLAGGEVDPADAVVDLYEAR
jgi:hypothetical protein